LDTKWLFLFELVIESILAVLLFALVLSPDNLVLSIEAGVKMNFSANGINQYSLIHRLIFSVPVVVLFAGILYFSFTLYRKKPSNYFTNKLHNHSVSNIRSRKRYKK